MKKRKSIFYILEDISEGKGKAFKATVTLLDNAIVFGADKKEIEEGIECACEFEQKKEKGKHIV